MVIKSRKLNEGERFCSSKKVVNSIFGTYNLLVNFAHFKRNYENSFSKKLYKGKIIASLVINNRDLKPTFFPTSDWPVLNFYVLKEKEFSEELERIFSTKILPAIFDLLKKHNKGNPDNTSGYYIIEIELLNNELILHERLEKC